MSADSSADQGAHRRPWTQASLFSQNIQNTHRALDKAVMGARKTARIKLAANFLPSATEMQIVSRGPAKSTKLRDVGG